MRLGLPGSFEGGMMLFIAAIAITLVELYVVKKANLSLRTAIRSPQQFACEGIGGKWYPNRDSKDPCCMLPTGINKVDVDGFPICQGTRVPFP